MSSPLRSAPGSPRATLGGAAGRFAAVQLGVAAPWPRAARRAACALALAGWWWGSERSTRSTAAPSRRRSARRSAPSSSSRRRRARRSSCASVRSSSASASRARTSRCCSSSRPAASRRRAHACGARPCCVRRACRRTDSTSGPGSATRRPRRAARRRVASIGRRGGLGGVADRLTRWLARTVAPGLEGSAAAVIEGVVLGEDQGLSDGLKQRFRASGLYHLLAVSGSNVRSSRAGMLGLPGSLGVSRARRGARRARRDRRVRARRRAAAVGDPRGGRGRLGSLAWLTGRERDRWYSLLVAARRAARLESRTTRSTRASSSRSPRCSSIFVLAPRFRRVLEGYPLPPRLRAAVAISAACGLGTAPVCWLQFHAIPLLTVPGERRRRAGGRADARARARLGARRAGRARPGGRCSRRRTAGAPPTSPAARGSSAACRARRSARPLRPPRSPRCVLLAAAYAWRRGERAEAGLPAHRHRPAEDRARAAPPAGPHRRRLDRAPDAREASAEDAIASCNAMGLFGGEPARDRRGGRTLEGAPT